MGGEVIAWIPWSSWIQWDKVQLGELGTWVSAIGTVGAFIWAINRTLKESRESKVLTRRAESDKRAAEAERVKAHAQQIHARPSIANVNETTVNYPSTIIVGNSSQQPVYQLVCYLVWIQGSAFRTGEEAESYMRDSSESISDFRAVVQVLPPGEYSFQVKGPSSAPMQGQLGVEIAFTDRGGRSWVRRASGELLEISHTPFEYYGLEGPFKYSLLREYPPS